MTEYLSAQELADLVGCKPNQRAAMRNWLVEERWAHTVGKDKLPRVLRAYRDRKLGMTNEKKANFDQSPNRSAFVGKNQRSASV